MKRYLRNTTSKMLVALSLRSGQKIGDHK